MSGIASTPPAAPAAPTPPVLRCEHCGQVLSRLVKGMVKLSVPSRLVAFDPEHGGQAEMSCPTCGRDTRLPIRFVLRPAGLAAAGAGG
jgi:hypothetical protein